MRIEIEISEKNESTSYPWWMIIIPQKRISNVEEIANLIVGPFFNREEADAALNSRRYEYGSKAIVWCASGYHSRSYRDAIDEAHLGGGKER